MKQKMTPDQLQWVVDHNQQIRAGHRVQICDAVDAWRETVRERDALLAAARTAIGQFKAIMEHQHNLLVRGQNFESAAANWDKATLGQSIDFGPLMAAVEMVEVAQAAAAVDPYVADTGTPPTREKNS